MESLLKVFRARGRVLRSGSAIYAVFALKLEGTQRSFKCLGQQSGVKEWLQAVYVELIEGK